MERKDEHCAHGLAVALDGEMYSVDRVLLLALVGAGGDGILATSKAGMRRLITGRRLRHETADAILTPADAENIIAKAVRAGYLHERSRLGLLVLPFADEAAIPERLSGRVTEQERVLLATLGEVTIPRRPAGRIIAEPDSTENADPRADAPMEVSGA